MVGNQIISQKMPAALAILKVGNLGKSEFFKRNVSLPQGVRISRQVPHVHVFVTFYLFIYLLLIITTHMFYNDI